MSYPFFHTKFNIDSDIIKPLDAISPLPQYVEKVTVHLTKCRIMYLSDFDKNTMFQHVYTASEFKTFRTNVAVMARMIDGTLKVHAEFEEDRTQPQVAFAYIERFKKGLRVQKAFKSEIDYIYPVAKPTGSDKYIRLGENEYVGVSYFSSGEKTAELKLSDFVDLEFNKVKRKLVSGDIQREDDTNLLYRSEETQLVSTSYGNFNAYVEIFEKNPFMYKVKVLTKNKNGVMRLKKETIGSDIYCIGFKISV